MDIFCIDESGSINNHPNAPHPYFTIALVRVLSRERLKRLYKRFVSSNLSRLKELDKPKIVSGKVVKPGSKMFLNGKFHELKGSQFDPDMKRAFLKAFSIPGVFEVYTICLDNQNLTDSFCHNMARAFNYILKLTFTYLIHHGFLPSDTDYTLHIDERNERTDAKKLLEEYLNMELSTSGVCSGSFSVSYFDSSHNTMVQIADVFSNLFYSNLITKGNYGEEIEALKNMGIWKYTFHFPQKSPISPIDNPPQL